MVWFVVVFGGLRWFVVFSATRQALIQWIIQPGISFDLMGYTAWSQL